MRRGLSSENSARGELTGPPGRVALEGRKGLRALLLAGVVALLALALPALAGAATITLNPIDRETEDPILNYRYIVNEDIAHDTASTTNPRTYSPLVLTGCHDHDDPPESFDLGPGKYLVTILEGDFFRDTNPTGSADTDCLPTDEQFSASGYKLAGKHFTVGGDQTVTIDMVPNPLPTANLVVRVFHDNNSVGGEDDIPLEGPPRASRTGTSPSRTRSARSSSTTSALRSAATAAASPTRSPASRRSRASAPASTRCR